MIKFFSLVCCCLFTTYFLWEPLQSLLNNFLITASFPKRNYQRKPFSLSQIHKKYLGSKERQILLDGEVIIVLSIESSSLTASDTEKKIILPFFHILPSYIRNIRNLSNYLINLDIIQNLNRTALQRFFQFL